MIKGIVRKLDDLGRVTLPKEYRKVLNINESDPVDMYLDNGIICIKPAKLQCVICGTEENGSNLITVEGVHLCRDCGCKVIDHFMD